MKAVKALAVGKFVFIGQHDDGLVAVSQHLCPVALKIVAERFVCRPRRITQDSVNQFCIIVI